MREFHELAQLCLRTLAKKGWVSLNHSDSHFPSLFHFQPITVCHPAFPVLCTCNPPSTTVCFKNPFDLSVCFGVVVFQLVFLDSAHAVQKSIPNLRWDVRKLKVLFYSKFSMQVNPEFLCGDYQNPKTLCFHLPLWVPFLQLRLGFHFFRKSSGGREVTNLFCTFLFEASCLISLVQ